MNIPRIQTLNYFVQNAFLANEFRQMELLLLEFFCWNLILPTSGKRPHPTSPFFSNLSMVDYDLHLLIYILSSLLTFIRPHFLQSLDLMET